VIIFNKIKNTIFSRLNVRFLCLGLLLPAVLFSLPSYAAEDEVCAVVKIEIQQELTLERQAFDAKMNINNGLEGITLENLAVNVNFKDKDGNNVIASSNPDATDAAFFIRVDSITGTTDITGSGTIAPKSAAEIHWLIIPAPGSGGVKSTGELYFVGASLSYNLGGELKTTVVTPDSIYVKPLPLLTLDYFLEKDVFADDAFTAEVEPAVPFTLGVRVKNNGAASATGLKIDSAQPKIVENKQGLLIGFNIIGSNVNELPKSNSLQVDFGEIQPNTASMARWDMVTTLSGRFTEFNADFSHADELGGRLTSIIDPAGIATHHLIRNVRVDLAGRDNVRDFLALDNNVYRVFESSGVDTDVTDVSPSSTLVPFSVGTEAALTLTTPVTAGFSYVKLPDPYNGEKVVKQAVRSDGKLIPLDNAWTSKTRNLETNPPSWDYFVNVFDAKSTGTYSLLMGEPELGPTSPVFTPMGDVTSYETATISFPVSATDANGDVVTLTAGTLPAGASFSSDNSGSGTLSWSPAIGQAGNYTLNFTAYDGGLTSEASVNIKVNPAWDTDGDGLDDDWERQHFGDLSRDGTGDFDGDGVSDLDEYLAETDPTIEPPLAPVNIIALPGNAENTLSWDAVTDAVSYKIYWGLSETVNPTSGTLLEAPTATYLHTALENDVTYYYVVSSVGIGGESAPSAVVSVTTGVRDWTTPVSLQSSASTLSQNARVAMSADGVAMAVWQQTTAAGLGSIWSSRYVKATGWTTPVLVSDSAFDASAVQLAMDDAGNAIAVWQQVNGLQKDVMAARFDVATSTWSVADVLDTDDVTAALNPQIAMNQNGTALVVWQQGLTIVEKHYNVDTGWATAKTVSTEVAGELSKLTLTFNDSGDAFAAWRVAVVTPATATTPEQTHYDLRLAQLINNTWSASETVATGLDDWAEPAIAMNDTSTNNTAAAIMAWSAFNGTRHVMMTRQYRVATGWSSAAAMDTSAFDTVTSEAKSAQVAIDVSGNAFVTWAQSSSPYSIYANRFDVNTGFSGVVLLEQRQRGDAMHPRLIIDSRGNAVVTWQQDDGVQQNILAAEYSVADATWAQERVIESSNMGDATSPTIAVSDNGNAVVVWQQKVDSHFVIAANHFEAANQGLNNIAPIALAGNDASVDEQTTVTLDGSDSFDQDGSITAYVWKQTVGLPVVLSATDIAKPSFEAPVVFASEGAQVLTFELTVSDNGVKDETGADDLSKSLTSVSTVNITINPVNILPTVSAGLEQQVNEQTLVALEGAATDEDGSVVSTQWRQVSGRVVTEFVNTDSLTPSFKSPVVLLQDGVQTLVFELTATDNEGESSSSLVNVLVEPVNIAPVVNAGVDVVTNEQTAISLTAAANDSDGSVATYQWTQVDGMPVDLTAVDTTAAILNITTPVVLVPQGPQVVSFRVTVTDNENVSGSDDVLITVNPVNAVPTVSAGLDKITNELELVVLTAAANDSDGSIITYQWQQTAGPGVAMLNANTEIMGFYAPRLKQQAVLSFRLTVTDNETASVFDDVSVTVNPVNTLPIANAGNDQTVAEYLTVSLDGSASNDPDVDGVISTYRWTQTGGKAVSLVNANTAIAHFTAPAVYQNEVLNFRLDIVDDEGGAATAYTNVTLFSTNPDDDADGMADLWEIQYFGNLNRNGTDDDDGDGATDLMEHDFGTDPFVAQGPGQPQILSPSNVEVTTLQPILAVSNGEHNANFTTTYQYQVFNDAAMTVRVAEGLFVAEGNGSTSWAVDIALNDNTHYYWRARASGWILQSDWVSSTFFVNTVNDAPGQFNISAPQDNVWVKSFTPELSVTNSTDVDEDNLSYRFEVYSDQAMTSLITAVDNILPGANGVTAWAVDTVLTENSWVTWRAVVTDEHGLSTISDSATIFINTVNDAPSVPVLISPLDRSEITTQFVDMVVENAIEPEAETVTYLFELDTVNTFDSVNKRASVALAEGIDETAWFADALLDNTWYYWRVKASDGRAQSAWMNGQFFVNTVNDAPGIPTLDNPSDNGWVGTMEPSLTVLPAVDIDEDVLRYEFEIYMSDKYGREGVLHNSAISDNTYWQVSPSLPQDGWYYWRARAIDEHGLEGEWATPVYFFSDSDGVNNAPVIKLDELELEHKRHHKLCKLKKDIREDWQDKHEREHKRKDYEDPCRQYVEIEWKDYDPDSNAYISLYYSNSNEGEDGTLIIDGLREDPDHHHDKAKWDVTDLADGVYFVYAVIDDGTTRVVKYSPNAIVVGDGAGQPYIEFEDKHHEYKHHRKKKQVKIKWDDLDSDSNALISLYYDTDMSDYDGVPITVGIEEDPDHKSDRFKWDVTELPEGKYFIYAIIEDGTQRLRVYSRQYLEIEAPYKKKDKDDKKKH